MKTYSNKDIIDMGLNTLSECYYKHGLKFLKRDNKVIVFLDDDNYIEIQPKSVCIPCIHDPVEQRAVRKELNL